MKRKPPKRKTPHKKPAPKPGKQVAEKAPEPVVGNRSNARLPAIILGVFGFLLYANTLTFQFALDDKLYVTHNQFTKNGVAGIPDIWTNELLTGFFGVRKELVAGGRYRPIPLTLHAIEWELLGPDENDDKQDRQDALDTLASWSHFFNAGIYGLTGFLLFSVLAFLFPNTRAGPFYFSFAFLATAFFLAHPLHTEVVANVKSRDELMSVAGALLALWLFLRYLATNRQQFLVFSSAVFMGALFCKESSITFLGIIPLTAYFFTRNQLSRIAMTMVPLVAVAVVYIGLRYLVLGSSQTAEIGELMNNPFVGATGEQKYATVLMTMGLYVKLLFFPHPLTHDYYPYHIPLVEWSEPMAWGSVVLYLGLIGVALWGLPRKTMYSYGILVFLGSFILFSNLVFPIGTFMNERFMYIPSIGFSMIIAHVLVNLTPGFLKNMNTQTAVVAVVSAMIIGGFSLENRHP